ncbi:YggT family protein [Helicobacter ailurogastricus]|uniref:Integral membrane protein YggT, involved in response to extracytoplasmic stress (Osmotic shock) n=1 Tax=Helicobacter ailurogastricus TaxID=1578720 RepID=A0A0K2XBD4_9HELI|nr:YggT family protein [Helicobacter ailurogastricus]CRF41157.1 Integral membrane protein YggT, involved in response to extracytoplasmic stress (osmotic shock) [Helicobacter ailurogastricus]CRF43381.1 Integral membrane protein YggT, involved in response to extracytoplasmic stress (osmotic shock) [Helicobacter ailurogastricus]CRF44442.1 Integral membrane protein YggT, involved in response to extracytoplasmic stress (osmotic shock) [Helicobacter ailurogastricus]GMB90722.1 Proton-translocating hyd
MVANTILSALATILHSLITLYIWIIIIAALLSFVRPDPNNAIVQMLYRLTEPTLNKAKQLAPFLVFNGIDLSPLAVVLVLKFFDMTAVQLMFSYAQG